MEASAAWIGAGLFSRLRNVEEVAPVLPNWPMIRVKTDMPYVCIGIDDGWWPERVEQFLMVMEEYKRTRGVEPKFTVFPVGKVMVQSPDLWRAVKAAGHVIGNHSHSHLYIRGKSENKIRSDFDYFEEVDYPEVFGEAFPKPGCLRVPFAEAPVKANHNVWDIPFKMNDFDVHWIRDTYSWNTNGKNIEANRKYCLKMLGRFAQGDIAVMHFLNLDMVNLPTILDNLEKQGLKNVPFPDLWEARDRNYYGG
jgi:peptidoglycan/xylan/chitin deacetylase (PgdA/CDA1 family)